LSKRFDKTPEVAFIKVWRLNALDLLGEEDPVWIIVLLKSSRLLTGIPAVT
jgi:hypothetical protein